jgi:hypothetical protein
MKYNIFSFTINSGTVNFDFVEQKSDALEELLNKIQLEIVKLYIEKQTKRSGIQKLGNEIRYSVVLNSYFENASTGFYLIKSTENSRYFVSKFIDVTISKKQEALYFFILEDQFGKESKLVDSSFIRLNQIKKELQDFFSIYHPRIVLPKIYFIEITGFTDYFFENRKGFNFIHKLNKHD